MLAWDSMEEDKEKYMTISCAHIDWTAQSTDYILLIRGLWIPLQHQFKRGPEIPLKSITIMI